MDNFNNTVFIGKVFIDPGEVDSTNSYALQMLKLPVVPIAGTVIFSSSQTKGRGQRGNLWYSENGRNIALSIILYPRFLFVQQQFYLSMAVALGVCRFLQHLIPTDEVFIKWPNDLYVQHKKIGGILIENSLTGNMLSVSVVGIGLNTNQTHFKQLPNATSLSLVTDRQFELIPLAQKLCEYVEATYFMLQPDKLADLKRQYLQKLYQFGVNRHFRRTANGDKLYGRISNVLDNGRLLLTYADEQAESFDIKEIEWVW